MPCFSRVRAHQAFFLVSTSSIIRDPTAQPDQFTCPLPLVLSGLCIHHSSLHFLLYVSHNSFIKAFASSSDSHSCLVPLSCAAIFFLTSAKRCRISASFLSMVVIRLLH